MSSNYQTPLISVRDLDTRFGSHVIHQNLSLEIYEGEILGIVGGSGTGKSVLLKEILGLIRPYKGEIVFHNSGGSLDVTAIGVLFQDGALFSALTVRQNIQVPMREMGDVPMDLMDDLAALKIEMVGLPPEAAHKTPSQLSGGMRKRAGLARALAMDPKIVFLDEPTAGLDPMGAAEFDELILQLRKDLGLTVVMVTHDLDSLYRVTDRVAVLAEKQVIAADSVEALEKNEHPWIKAYFHGVRSRQNDDKR